MKYDRLFHLIFILFFSASANSQITEAFDDFEGNSNIPGWAEDDCMADPNTPNPFQEGINLSSTVLRYGDTGGQYANIRFQMPGKFDLSNNQTFSIKIYVPSDDLTGTQNNQVSLKLQNGDLAAPWTTQCEVIKNIVVDEWQTVTFDFAHDPFLNFDSGSEPPILRTDFNRVLLQVNGENNNDRVVAYIDDVQLFESPTPPSIFNQLIWSDEFDTNGPIDAQKWHHQTKIPQGNSWFNNEIQHYTSKLDNSFVEDGFLKIVAKREQFTDQGVTKNHTSARLNSKFAFTYGRVEIRAKLPFGVGTWPAIWMLGKNVSETGAYWETQGFGTVGWPACGEIDIMEHWGANQDHVSSAIHTPSSFGGTINSGGRNLDNASEEFHVYAMEWTEETISFSVDGVVHYNYKPVSQNLQTWPFDLDQYLIFNIAILPEIDPNFTESSLEIDYVRVYQQGEETSTEELAQESVRVFPNPFENQMTIELENTSSNLVNVKIFNSRGDLVQSRKVRNSDGQIHIDQLGQLPTGIYIVQYEIDGQSKSFKTVKL